EVEEAGKAIGMTIVDEFDFYKKEKNALVLTEVDSEKTMKMFMNRIFPGNEELIEAMGGNL
ncbi:MAG: nucleoside hydrolase, partial [Peptacetobacter hiranonis]|nr:nucleoside hydrolase [Peptacetobacter hiranonis]